MSAGHGGVDRGDELGAPGGLDGAVTEPEHGAVVLDPAVVAADDLLLDALARGGPAPTGDPLAGLLAAWRADLDDGVAEVDGQRHEGGTAGTTANAAAGAARSIPRRPGPPWPALRQPAPGTSGPSVAGPASPSAPRSGPPGRPVRSRTRRLVRHLALSAVAAIVTTALLGIGVNSAGPDSPLWPIASAVYPDRSAVRAVEHAIALAGDATVAGRYDDARRHLDEALAQLAEVRDPTTADRLSADIDRVRLGLPQPSPAHPAPAATPTTPGPHRTTSTGAGAPTRTPAGTRSPAPRPSPSSPPPGNPSPRRVLPLPVPILPSLLPSGLPLLPSGGCVLLCPAG